jgi:DNA (cytosine-5)-methyltransferase 1
MSQAGHDCVFASEKDAFCRQVYQANFGMTPAGDITQIEAHEIPDHDILLGGFPCQPFSQAGKRKGFEDSRGTMIYEILRILEAKKPEYFILENVKQLVYHDKGKTIASILGWLIELGYKVEYRVLNSNDFGVPQKRERVFFLGTRNGIIRWPDVIRYETRVGDILETGVDPKYTLSDKLWEGHVGRKQKHIEKGNGFGYSLFYPDNRYTNTISARYHKDGSEILIHQEGKNPRRLTPRECARLQGFPDSFKIVCSDTQTYRQFGNAVCVPVVLALAKFIVPS